MNLTAPELLHLLECIKRAHNLNIGYADDPRVAKIQGKLSMMLEYEQQRCLLTPENTIPLPEKTP